MGVVVYSSPTLRSRLASLSISRCIIDVLIKTMLYGSKIETNAILTRKLFNLGGICEHSEEHLGLKLIKIK